MVGTGVVLAEVGVDKGMVWGLVIDPQKEELVGLEVGLKLEGNNLELNGTGQEGF
jgi:hypothetical protein